MNKSELLHWLQEEYRQWQGFLDQIRPEWMERPGVNGDWSMKDMLAHLTGYQPRVNASIQAALRGESEPPPPWPAHLQTDDEINAWIYESNRGRSLDEVLDESRIAEQCLGSSLIWQERRDAQHGPRHQCREHGRGQRAELGLIQFLSVKGAVGDEQGNGEPDPGDGAAGDHGGIADRRADPPATEPSDAPRAADDGQRFADHVADEHTQGNRGRVRAAEEVRVKHDPGIGEGK